MKSHPVGVLFLALAASIWGGMYVVSKMVLRVVDPVSLVWLRYVVAVIFLVLAGILTRQKWTIRWRDFPLVVSIGVIGYGVSIYTQFLGTKLSTAETGAIITSATPAFMVMFSAIILNERITRRRLLSIATATSGIILIVGTHTQSHAAAAHAAYARGALILVVAALTWALMSVLVKLVPKDYSLLVITTYAIFVATLLLTPMTLIHLGHTAKLIFHPGILAGIFYLGVVSTAGAFFLWNKGLQLTDAGSGGLYFLFQPLVGTFLGWLVLGETLNVAFWLGAALVMFGLGLVVRDVPSPRSAADDSAAAK
ncbi:DMT family transporter [Alicyclobacillus mengziensis]|uniref:DMT family transporter n=1 Tax=Alicyclobacillus mengziensis TaxID=2931921 RepID=A0A9X7W1C5_9BACL|nr:DMT family transporter [Alicyclobacillus mengziensis]QSO48941.1 DMT family transporter [Alicyclobacillus mengziensis]